MLMPIKHLLERRAYAIAVTFTIFIAIASLASLNDMKSLKISISNFDKFLHLLSYFILTLSWFFATQGHAKKVRIQKYLIIILITYGIILEAIQGVMTTHRQADIYDILANAFGVILGAALFSKLNRWFNSI